MSLDRTDQKNLPCPLRQCLIAESAVSLQRVRKLPPKLSVVVVQWIDRHASARVAGRPIEDRSRKGPLVVLILPSQHPIAKNLRLQRSPHGAGRIRSSGLSLLATSLHERISDRWHAGWRFLPRAARRKSRSFPPESGNNSGSIDEYSRIDEMVPGSPSRRRDRRSRARYSLSAHPLRRPEATAAQESEQAANKRLRITAVRFGLISLAKICARGNKSNSGSVLLPNPQPNSTIRDASVIPHARRGVARKSQTPIIEIDIFIILGVSQKTSSTPLSRFSELGLRSENAGKELCSHHRDR